MSYDDFGTGEGGFFDFNDDGGLDRFEQAAMLNEQDRECEEMFRKDHGGRSSGYSRSRNKKPPDTIDRWQISRLSL